MKGYGPAECNFVVWLKEILFIPWGEFDRNGARYAKPQYGLHQASPSGLPPGLIPPWPPPGFEARSSNSAFHAAVHETVRN